MTISRPASSGTAPHPEDGKPLKLVQGGFEGGPYSVLEEEPQLNSPGADDYAPQMFADIAKKLGVKM